MGTKAADATEKQRGIASIAGCHAAAIVCLLVQDGLSARAANTKRIVGFAHAKDAMRIRKKR
jgi:hypothetical protein